MVNIDINKIGNKLSRKFSGNLESISKLGDKIGDKINENLENINKLSDKISNKLMLVAVAITIIQTICAS